MKVYLVYYISTSYEDLVHGVFSSQSKADEYVRRTNDTSNHYVVEMEVDHREGLDSL